MRSKPPVDIRALVGRLIARLRDSRPLRWLLDRFRGRPRVDARDVPSADAHSRGTGDAVREDGLAGALAEGRLSLAWSEAFARSGRLRLAPWLPPHRPVLTLRASADPAPRRLLVWLHGCDQQPEPFASATRVHRLVTGDDWLVVMPAQERLANPHRCWNWFDAATVEGDGEVAIVLAAIDAAIATLPAPPAGVCIAGMSSGAALAAACVTAAPERFTAAAFHSGVAAGAARGPLSARRVLGAGPDGDVTRLGARHAPRPVASLTLHGRDDPVVAPAHARELVRQMLALDGSLETGAPLPAAERTETSSIGGREMVLEHYGAHQLALIAGLGHAWSGGDERWPYNDAMGPDATTMIGRFFDARIRAAATEHTF
ncbi:MAG: PHB depolymerase family esterase [Burkholderiaceae bacterium]